MAAAGTFDDSVSDDAPVVLDAGVVETGRAGP